MLVVIGVIMILMTLAVVGYQVVEKSAAANQTKVTLNNLNAMLSEFDAAAGSSALPVYTYTDAMNNTQVQNVIGAPPNALTPTPDGQIWSISDVTTSGSGDRYPPPSGNPLNVVGNTQQIMAKLMRIPNNANAIKQMPSSRLMKDQNGNPLTDQNGNLIPIILDGWGNPIIYVPAGGIWVWVTTGSGPTQILVNRPDKRPFFASAGPDGDFGAYSSTPPSQARGDDNVYSKD
jgi:type II secretory pathway pseudopilin PulG